jgi:hypothetical protein
MNRKKKKIVSNTELKDEEKATSRATRKRSTRTPDR